MARLGVPVGGRVRMTRAVGIIPATPYEVMVRCGLADGLFEQPAATTVQLPSIHALISAYNAGQIGDFALTHLAASGKARSSVRHVGQSHS